MPTYDFKCINCDYEFEELVKNTKTIAIQCPKCKMLAKKAMRGSLSPQIVISKNTLGLQRANETIKRRGKPSGAAFDDGKGNVF